MPDTTQVDPGQSRTRAEEAWQRALAAWARNRTLAADLEQVRSVPNLLHVSPLVRMCARYASMPVIEQAKGVLMAQQNCDAEQAFDLLRRASQRSNMPVRDLAAKIVQHAQQTGQGRGVGRAAG
jgi:hypothetical protein